MNGIGMIWVISMWWYCINICKIINPYGHKCGHMDHQTVHLWMAFTWMFGDNFSPSFHILQDKATTGKQGLGVKDQPKKIAGCHWKGKKTSFDDTDIEHSDDSNDPAKRKKIKDVEAKDVVQPKIKLKKLCRVLLNQVPIFAILQLILCLHFVNMNNHFSNLHSQWSWRSLNYILRHTLVLSFLTFPQSMMLCHTWRGR